MTRSLLMKFGMLAVTLGVLFWIGWQVPDAPSNNTASVDDSKVAPALSPVTANAEPSRPSQADQKLMAAESGAVKGGTVTGGTATHRVVDLNRATAKELESLPGIGVVLAERVIAYRKSVGRFQTVEDLREVAGIGAKKFDQLKPLVTVATADTTGKAEKRPL
ncbi:MAG: helix-hairpin-helix domain-containing protein [Nitrospira sp.]|nr:helix-hairpin-helix domain-containing protein [Nitrospira sp.]